MTTRLYLDSARMGLLSERARLAHFDYVRLAATEGCSLYFSQFLEAGFQDWPRIVRRRYPALADWQGIGELEDALRRMVGIDRRCQVMLANRSAQLVRLAAKQLCGGARRILVSDTMWPSYRRILEAERQRRRVGISTVSVRHAVRDFHDSTEKIVQRFEQNYDRMRCDGLFVPVISHDGIRLPVDTICRRLHRVRPLRFVVVDGAQAFGHVAKELGLTHCDIFLAGSHKWLQGHLPMGIAFLPKAGSADKLMASAERMLRHGELDDPLLTFTRELSNGRAQPYSETVNLASLFTCRAAIASRRSTPQRIDISLKQRLRNAERVTTVAVNAGWSRLPEAMPTGIVMLQSGCDTVRNAEADRVRRFLVAHGISASTYNEGTIRLAMPDWPLAQGGLDLLEWTLRRCRFPDVADASPSQTSRPVVVHQGLNDHSTTMISSNGLANSSN